MTGYLSPLPISEHFKSQQDLKLIKLCNCAMSRRFVANKNYLSVKNEKLSFTTVYHFYCLSTVFDNENRVSKLYDKNGSLFYSREN